MYAPTVDAATVVLSLVIYRRQATYCLEQILKFKDHIAVSGRSIRDKYELGPERLWNILTGLFWRWIVQNNHGWGWDQRKENEEDRRWLITVPFIIVASAGWLILLRTFGLTDNPVVWLLYTIYFSLITAWAIPFAMCPSQGSRGIEEQCWFVFRSHIVISIPSFYAVVAYSAWLLTMSRVGTFVDGLELSALAFALGVAVVTILDTSITIWTLANSHEVESLNLLSTDQYGGTGGFMNLITSNAAFLGALAVLQSSKFFFPVYIRPFPPYLIPPLFGVPLLLLLTYLVSNYFLHNMILSLKKKYLPLSVAGLTGQQNVPRLANDEKTFLSSLSPFERRNFILNISTWPVPNSILITTIVALVQFGLSQQLGLTK